MENKIELITNQNAAKILGVEVFNWNYKLLEGENVDSCIVEIICELKFVNDKKTKNHRIIVSFAAKDEQSQLVGTGYELIYEKQEFFIEDVFKVRFDCSVNKDKIGSIKAYINNR